jgi:SAM-dependent methyltransferase
MKDHGIADASTQVVEYFAVRAGEYQAKSERFPWAWLRLREAVAVRSLLGHVVGADILELGAGAGFYTRRLIAFGARHVWAVDPCAAMLAALPAGPVTAVLGCAETFRLDRRFPILLCAGMLEFLPDPAAALANAAPHAEPGARFVLLMPHANLLGRLYRQFHRLHGLSIHLFEPSWLEATAPRHGWRLDKVVPVFPFSLAVRLCRT